MSMSATDRRSFLKVGAMAATPVAMFAPAAVLADDGTRARLALLEDERAIEGLARSFMRRFSAADAAACGDFVAGPQAICLDPGIDTITEDTAADAAIELAEDGTRATYRRACAIERVTQFSGDSTVERMARFQGQAEARYGSKAVLDAELARTADGWTITRLALV